MCEDFVIQHALECCPPAERARLTKIIAAMCSAERETINDAVRYHLHDFNYYLSETPGSVSQIAYAALVDAIKAVKTGGIPTRKVLGKRP